MKPRPELLPSIALIGALGLAALLILRPIGPAAPLAQNGRLDIAGGDYESLSVAVSRIFGARVIPGGAGGRSELRVGALPPNMPFELVIPPGTTIVGSLYGEMPGEAQIVMDSSADQDDLIAVYENSLTGQGFSQERLPTRLAAIQPADQVGAAYNGTFCRSRDSVLIDLNISPRPDGPTGIGVYANWRSQSVSCLGTDPLGVIGVGEKLVPPLKTPPGSVVVQSSGGGGSMQEGLSFDSAEIDYHTTPRALAEYLNPQLEAAGWKLNDATISDVGAWSTWTVMDAEGHPWAGALVIIASPISDRLSIRVEVRRQSEANR